MSDSVYGVIAYLARYWLLGLMIIILWRAVLWLRKDAYRTARAQSRLPDAGFIGEWAVTESNTETMPEGMLISAPRDGWVGSARSCDIRVKSAEVPARAARFFLRRDGLHMLPRRAGVLTVDGEPVRREAVLRHGAMMTVGEVTLQLRLFAGVLLTGEAPAAGRRKKRGDYDMEIVKVETIEANAARMELPKPVLSMKYKRGKAKRGTTPKT